MNDTPRAKHLAWCKERASALVAAGDLSGAIASMVSDMGKSPLTADSVSGPLGGTLLMLGMMELANGGSAVQRWIDGFN